MSINDNVPTTTPLAVSPLPDAHGHAALILVESLIHGLCENARLNTAQAIEIVDRAVAVQAGHAEAAENAAVPMWQAHALLSSLGESLRIDG